MLPGGALWNKLVLFLETFDPVQMRYAGHEYKKLVDYVEPLARDAGSVCVHATVLSERSTDVFDSPVWLLRPYDQL